MLLLFTFDRLNEIPPGVVAANIDCSYCNCIFEVGVGCIEMLCVPCVDNHNNWNSGLYHTYR